MSSIVSRIATVGIIAGGFALTGDLGRLAKRGFEVVNARDIPSPRAEQPTDQPGDQADHRIDTSLEPVLGEKPDERQAATPATGTASGPSGLAGPRRQAASVTRDDFRPPRDGVDQVSLAALDAGDRVVVWLALPRRSGGRAYRCLVFDVIEPAGGEALAYEAVSFAADGTPQATAVPPRRVRLVGDGLGGSIVTSGMIDLGRRGVTADGIGHEQIGPVAALNVVR